MGFEDGIRVLAASLFVAVLLEIAVIAMGDGVVGELAKQCAAQPGATFDANDLAVAGIIICHYIPVVIAGCGFIYAFIKIFEPGRRDRRRLPRRRG